jgi:hypothetical protein
LGSFIGSGIIICGMAGATFLGGAGYQSQTVDAAADARPAVLGSGDLTLSLPAPQRPSITYFLVGSLEQHDRVLAEQTEIAGRASAGEQERWFAVLLAGTLEQEKEAWDQIEAAKSNGLRCCQSLRFVDLRH